MDRVIFKTTRGPLFSGLRVRVRHFGVFVLLQCRTEDNREEWTVIDIFPNGSKCVEKTKIVVLPVAGRLSTHMTAS